MEDLSFSLQIELFKFLELFRSSANSLTSQFFLIELQFFVFVIFSCLFFVFEELLTDSLLHCSLINLSLTLPFTIILFVFLKLDLIISISLISMFTLSSLSLFISL